MRKLLHIADHPLELEVTADEDGLTVTATAHFAFTPILSSVIPWSQFRQEDNPNGKAAPLIGNVDEANSEDSAQAHEGRSVTRDVESDY